MRYSSSPSWRADGPSSANSRTERRCSMASRQRHLAGGRRGRGPAGTAGTGVRPAPASPPAAAAASCRANTAPAGSSWRPSLLREWNSRSCGRPGEQVGVGVLGERRGPAAVARSRLAGHDHARGHEVGDDLGHQRPARMLMPRAMSALVVARPSEPTTHVASGRCSTTRWCDSGDSSSSSPPLSRRKAKRDSRIGRVGGQRPAARARRCGETGVDRQQRAGRVPQAERAHDAAGQPVEHLVQVAVGRARRRW